MRDNEREMPRECVASDIDGVGIWYFLLMAIAFFGLAVVITFLIPNGAHAQGMIKNYPQLGQVPQAASQSWLMGMLGLGDFTGLLRAIVQGAAWAAAAIVLARFTGWKAWPKDAYDASWLALGWCALAFVVGRQL